MWNVAQFVECLPIVQMRGPSIPASHGDSCCGSGTREEEEEDEQFVAIPCHTESLWSV